MHYFKVRDTVLSTIFIFIITGLLGLLVINIHVFDPFKRAFQDFEFTDIYYSKIQNENPEVDTSIVVINIGNLSRDSIAIMLNRVNAESPSVIGLDAFFTVRKNMVADSLLKSAFSATKNLVLAGIHSSDEECRNSIVGTNAWFGNYAYTYANLTGNEENTTTVREFRPFIASGDSVWSSFAAEIVKKANLPAWERLKARDNEREIINYTGGPNSFLCIDYKDIFNSAKDLSILKNRIVLIGYLGRSFQTPQDMEDLHFTPMNPKVSGRAIPDMRGILIHANIISMVLHDNYILIVPSLVNWLIAFVICFMHLALFIFLYLHRHKWYHFAGKIIQFVTSILLIWLSFLIYEHFGIKFSVAPAVVVITLSMDLLYFYEGLVKFLGLKFGFKSIFDDHQHIE